jgi:plastocyanin
MWLKRRRVHAGLSRGRWRQTFAAAALMAFAAHAVAADAAHALTPATAKATPGAAKVLHAVTIDALEFSPQVTVVHAGDAVTWTNKDPFPHTVTSKEGGFDSHDIAPGKTWTFVARKTGVFPYLCALHTTMTGTLKVE